MLINVFYPILHDTSGVQYEVRILRAPKGCSARLTRFLGECGDGEHEGDHGLRSIH